MSPYPMVHLVDDEAGLRRALTRLLSANGLTVRAHASAEAFLDAYNATEPACLILDVAMPGIDGLELQRRLTRDGTLLPIVFLTGHGDIPMSVEAIKAGAVDFLTKPVDEAALLGAVRSALKLADEQASQRREMAPLRARLDQLTPREREVLEHVVAGRLNKQIAADLGTGEQTIKVHRGRVMEKMGVESLADLVRVAERLGVKPAR